MKFSEEEKNIIDAYETGKIKLSTPSNIMIEDFGKLCHSYV